jgi:hypothetical protein
MLDGGRDPFYERLLHRTLIDCGVELHKMLLM